MIAARWARTASFTFKASQQTANMSPLEKLISLILNLAEKRRTDLISIDSELALGNGKTPALYTDKIAAAARLKAAP